MSKHAIDDDDKGDFWKKMRYGAAAAVTLGSGLYAVTSVLKKQGFSSFVDEVKTAMQTAPTLWQTLRPRCSPTTLVNLSQWCNRPRCGSSLLAPFRHAPRIGLP